MLVTVAPLHAIYFYWLYVSGDEVMLPPDMALNLARLGFVTINEAAS